MPKEGWLTKQGESFLFMKGKWQRRWFVLDEDNCTLAYYEEKGDPATIKGSIDLSGASIVESKVCLEVKKMDFCFGINSLTGRTYYIVAEHAGEARDWVNAIKDVIKAAKRRKREEKRTQSQKAALRSRPGAGLASDFVVVEVQKERQELAAKYSTEIVEELDLHPACVSLTNAFARYRKEAPAKATVVGSTASSAPTSKNLARTRTRIHKLLYSDRSGFSSKDAFEKSVVTWDTSSACKACNAGFSLLKSKTHCRLCGVTVCDNDACCSLLNLGEMGKLTDVYQGQPKASDRDLVVPICHACESEVQLAGKATKLDIGQESRTQMQGMYKEACELKAQTQRELHTLEDLVKEVVGGNTAPAVRDQAVEKHQAILTNLKTLIHTTSALEKLPVQDKRSQRQKFQSAVHHAFNSWAKETKYRANSLVDTVSRRGR